MSQLLPTPEGWPRVTLARAGTYDPADGLSAAEARGAWTSWRHAVDTYAPEALVRLMDEADLAGRGGAGYPAARKWRTCRAQASPVRYAVANGYEADPGTAVDRTLMELDPHAVVEGLALAAYAVGAREAFLAVRADYGLAVDLLQAAVDEADEAGYIGTNAMDAGFDVVIEVRPLRGAAIIGEETALLRALEGKRAMPDQRPPHPEVRGLFGKPTVVHSVETLAAVPWIVQHGPAAFASLERNGCTGTKLVQVSGAVRQPGMAEIPLGTPLREIIERVAGGPAEGSTLKAVLVGGPAGGIPPARPARHAARPRRAPGRGGDHGFRVHHRPRRARLHRGPRPRPRALHERRGLREVHPLPDRDAPPLRDRGPHSDRTAAPDGSFPARGSLGGRARRLALRTRHQRP